MKTLESILDTNLNTVDTQVREAHCKELIKMAAILGVNDTIKLEGSELTAITSKPFIRLSGDSFNIICRKLKDLGVDTIRIEEKSPSIHTYTTLSENLELPHLIARRVDLSFGCNLLSGSIETDWFDINEQPRGKNIDVVCTNLTYRFKDAKIRPTLGRGVKIKAERVTIPCNFRNGIVAAQLAMLARPSDQPYTTLIDFMIPYHGKYRYVTNGDPLFAVTGNASDIIPEIEDLGCTCAIIKNESMHIAFVKEGKEDELYKAFYPSRPGNFWKNVLVGDVKPNKQQYTNLWPVTKDGYRMILFNN